MLPATAVLCGVVWLGWHFLVPYEVQAVRPSMQPIGTGLRGAGELAARNQVKFSSKVTLRLLALRVDTGDAVRAGQLLGELDTTELRAEEAAARASVGAARASLEASRAAAARQQALLQHAGAEAGRSRELARRGRDAISANDLEAAELSEKTAALDLQAALAQVKAGGQTLLQARKDLEAAIARVSDSRFVAPFSGLVTSRTCSVGDTVAPGTTCLVVTELKSLYVSVRFDESVLSTIRPGDVAQIYLKSQPQRLIRGRVERVNRNVDADTREFTADIAFARIPDVWALGERAVVVVYRPAPAVLAVPREFISQRGKQVGVWVERNGRAAWNPVRTGASNDRFVEITEGVDRSAIVLQPGSISVAQRVRARLEAA